MESLLTACSHIAHFSPLTQGPLRPIRIRPSSVIWAIQYDSSLFSLLAHVWPMTSFGPYEALCNSWPINGPW